ncbi:MAG: amidohydrolase family protein [Pseudomonadota bacterium]
MHLARICLYVLVASFLCGFHVHAEPGEERRLQMEALGMQWPGPAPERATNEGQGPYQQLVIEGVMLVDGMGSPPRGPVNIIVSEDRIKHITSYPVPARDGEYRINGTGMTALPGFIDSHAHSVSNPFSPPDYVFKLWLAHGITTVRDVGSIRGLDFTVDHARRSDAGEITAPRIIPYSMFPGDQVVTAQGAKKWVRAVAKKGAKGVKLRGGTRQAQTAVLAETTAMNLGSANHHDQNGVYHMNALASARAGLQSLEHWYGLPEALFVDRTIQDYPPDYNYSDEQWRFGQAGRLWQQAAPPGSPKWEAVIGELIELDFTMVPTFTIYEANRDVARARDAEWHADYTLPGLMKFFMPDPKLHGSYHFDWTTADEVAWRNNFARWMQFINDYKNAGGRVAAGADAGFIFKLFGFAYIRELELLQEAGFHPLEVIQAATLNGAELLGMQDEIGSITVGKKADIVLVKGNPVANFKLLYGTGHMQLDRTRGVVERRGGVSYTIKDGIVFDAKGLLAGIKARVRAAKQ